jgi:hypothetical protein
MYELRGTLPGVATLFFERLNHRDRQGGVKENTRTTSTTILKPNKSVWVDWKNSRPCEEKKS